MGFANIQQQAHIIGVVHDYYTLGLLHIVLENDGVMERVRLLFEVLPTLRPQVCEDWE